ncbi:MAG: magnesium transporter [Lactobacillaceae bacterium]|jgi:magnesium transporter|nr:magnesium transporter [Lactobacillaceae bacterium]
MDLEDIRVEIVDHAESIQQALTTGDRQGFRAVFFELHEYDQSVVYLALPTQLRHQIIEWVTPAELSNVFDELDPEDVDLEHLLEEMAPRYVAEMLNAMYVDNAVDILTTLPADEVSMYLAFMGKADAAELRHLMNYADDTAGALMTTEFVSVPVSITISQAMAIVKKAAAESEQIAYIYVLDGTNQLVGVLSLRSMILASDDALVADIMDTNLITVGPNDDQEDVAHIMADYNFLAIPVVAKEHILGIIMIDDIVDVIDEEGAEDYSRLAGVDVVDLEESPFKSVIKRLPWLLALVFLGMGTATVIDQFEGLVQQASILAVFISLITGTAGNAGTQSLAVSIRRITLDEQRGLGSMLLGELLIGGLIGVTAGSTIFLVILLWKANLLLGVAVGLAMAVAILVANLAGAFIPLLMNALKVDPAVASGPFISTLSDLTSVIIYFNVAGFFLHHFAGL